MSTLAESGVGILAPNETLSTSEQAFYRELPNLLSKHPQRWVAYRGDEFLGSENTQTALYQRCIDQGLRPSEFVVLFVSEAALYDHEDIDLPASF